jgi:hypothetical protein
LSLGEVYRVGRLHLKWMILKNSEDSSGFAQMNVGRTVLAVFD